MRRHLAVTSHPNPPPPPAACRLPVWQDSDEVPYVYSYLCDLVEANQPAVLGPNNMNLPRIIAVIAEAFARSAVAAGDPTGVRLLNLVKQIQVGRRRRRRGGRWSPEGCWGWSMRCFVWCG